MDNRELELILSDEDEEEQGKRKTRKTNNKHLFPDLAKTENQYHCYFFGLSLSLSLFVGGTPDRSAPCCINNWLPAGGSTCCLSANQRACRGTEQPRWCCQGAEGRGQGWRVKITSCGRTRLVQPGSSAPSPASL